MKNMWIMTAVLLAGLSLGATSVDVKGDFAKIGKNNIPSGWYLNAWGGYKPHPKISIIKDGSVNALQFTEVKGKSGFGFVNSNHFAAKPGDVVTVTARVKGTGSVWFGLQSFAAKDKWTGVLPFKHTALTGDWKEITVDLPVTTLKGQPPTEAVMLTFGLDKADMVLNISTVKCEVKTK